MQILRGGRSALLVLALGSGAAVANGADAGPPLLQALDSAPFAEPPAPERRVRVSLDGKAEPLRQAPPRRIAASLARDEVTEVGSGGVRRRIRTTLDDENYLGDPGRAPAMPPAVPRRVIRQSLDDTPGPTLARRRIRTTLD